MKRAHKTPRCVRLFNAFEHVTGSSCTCAIELKRTGALTIRGGPCDT